MVSRFFFHDRTITDPHLCLQIWDDIAFASRNQHSIELD